MIDNNFKEWFLESDMFRSLKDFYGDNIIFISVGGSRLFGLETETSDYDIVVLLNDALLNIGKNSIDRAIYDDKVVHIYIKNLDKLIGDEFRVFSDVDLTPKFFVDLPLYKKNMLYENEIFSELIEFMFSKERELFYLGVENVLDFFVKRKFIVIDKNNYHIKITKTKGIYYIIALYYISNHIKNKEEIAFTKPEIASMFDYRRNYSNDGYDVSWAESIIEELVFNSEIFSLNIFNLGKIRELSGWYTRYGRR